MKNVKFRSAMQGGTYAAKAIVRKIEGKPKPAAFDYFVKEILLPSDARPRWPTFSVYIFGDCRRGWCGHLSISPTSSSSKTGVLIFVQWAIQDVTFNRGSRLITGLAPTDFNFNHAVAPERTARDAVAAKKNESAAA